MLDRISAGAQRKLDRIERLAVDGNGPAPPVRLRNRRRDFLGVERGHPRIGIATYLDAARPELDVIDAVLDLPADLLDNLRRPVDADSKPARGAPVAWQRVDHPARRPDDLSGRDHAGTAHLARCYGVAHRDGDVADSADISHRRVAGIKHQAAIHNGVDGSRLDRAAIDLLEATEAAVDEVHMAIDETGEQDMSRKIDHALVSTSLAVGRHRTRRCNPALTHSDKAPADRLVTDAVYQTRIDEDALGHAGDQRIAISFL